MHRMTNKELQGRLERMSNAAIGFFAKGDIKMADEFLEAAKIVKSFIKERKRNAHRMDPTYGQEAVKNQS